MRTKASPDAEAAAELIKRRSNPADMERFVAFLSEAEGPIAEISRLQIGWELSRAAVDIDRALAAVVRLQRERDDAYALLSECERYFGKLMSPSHNSPFRQKLRAALPASVHGDGGVERSTMHRLKKETMEHVAKQDEKKHEEAKKGKASSGYLDVRERAAAFVKSLKKR